MRLGLGISLSGPRSSNVPVIAPNLLTNSIFANSGGAAPTSWSQAIATGTSAPTASTLGAEATAYAQTATAQRPNIGQNASLVNGTQYALSMYIESGSGLFVSDVLGMAGIVSAYFLNGVSVLASASVAVGRLEAIFTSATTGAVGVRAGIGFNGNATGACTFSRPKLEVGSRATAWIA